MSSTTILLLIGLPVGAMMLGFIAITFAAGYAARLSVGPGRSAKGMMPRQVSPQAFAEAQAFIDHGKYLDAIKVIRKDSGMPLKDAKDYVDAMRAGRIPPPSVVMPPSGAGGRPLSERVRAFLDAGDHDSAVALVQAETGMSREEAVRFVDVLG
jgi:hypothetical protein